MNNQRTSFRDVWVDFSRKFYKSISLALSRLVLASGGSDDVTGLGVGVSGFNRGLLYLHTGEVDIGANWVLVEFFSRVDSRGIWAVSLPGLVGVEVHGGTGGVGVPCSVNIILGSGVPHLLVVLSHFFVEKLGGSADTEGGGGESSSRSYKSGEDKGFGVLGDKKRERRKKDDGLIRS